MPVISKPYFYSNVTSQQCLSAPQRCQSLPLIYTKSVCGMFAIPQQNATIKVSVQVHTRRVHGASQRCREVMLVKNISIFSCLRKLIFIIMENVCDFVFVCAVFYCEMST